MIESFTYDNLNRLYTYQVTGQASYTFNHSDNGNITSKTNYYAPGYEKEIKSGVTRELHYVSCPYDPTDQMNKFLIPA